jgi:hypothetical protein
MMLLMLFQNAQMKIVKLTKRKERFDPFMSILHQEKRKLLDDLMNGVED